MKTILFVATCAVVLIYALARLRKRPSGNLRSVDVIVPAFNEKMCIARTLGSLLQNRWVNNVICVNDGSTDGTAALLDRIAAREPRLIVVHQCNSGKGGAVMHGLKHVTTTFVFLTDADTRVPAKSDGLGHMLAELEAGADAVGGVPSSDLRRAGLLPHIRATVKLPMIVMRRMFQQILGGAPFIVSGSCGMFRVKVLKKVGLSDRTKVEDLDLTWSLVAQGYRVRQSTRCIVYPQECNSLGDEWRRWRRWITGYAVCMRLHWRLLPSRFGLLCMLPMFALCLLTMGMLAFNLIYAQAPGGDETAKWVLLVFPWLWVAIVGCIGAVSALHHKKPILVWLAPFAVFYVLLACIIWAVHGVRGFITGREPTRDKPTRYAHVVE